ncbi:DUF4956 domain-containing protein [Microlunatus elymi]|uniref:DUF4956 domain-containing protein n=1 Tax=Microlunatus elymi TaxID=2596828 RepID=A0A516PXR6_9ACTN|nr:DUF4956 domain-containing protein [Microlunatus elymi]QDP95970.1 DUF4956 domain-containing protein [Microlunatus elymi]
MSYANLLAALGIDAIAIAALSYVIYYRRHRRRDLALAFVALNVGVFAAVSMLSVQQGGIALGFGLFGILSIVRLRSSAISQIEVGYYFIALTLGLVNGLGIREPPIMITLDLILVGVMFALDRPSRRRIQSQTVVLDVVHFDRPSLCADLERRLGAELVDCTITEVDYVREVTVCEVRFRTASHASRAMEPVR